MQNKYYRGKFLIGVYGLLYEGEPLLSLCNNTHDFAKYLGTSIESARMILSKRYNNKIKYIKLCGRLRTVEFIEVR